MAPKHAAALLLSNAGQMPETSRVEGFSGKGACIRSTAELQRGEERFRAADTAFEAAGQWEEEQG